MVATYQVICHVLKSVGGVQPKGLVAPVALYTDTGLPLVIWQVLVVPVKTRQGADHEGHRAVKGETEQRKIFWCSHSTETVDTTGCVLTS